jgi:hypothetical protein
MEQRGLKNVNNYMNINIYSYLETFGGQSSNLYLNVVQISTPVLISNLWQPKAVVALHWCLLCTLPVFDFSQNKSCKTYLRPMLSPAHIIWQLIYPDCDAQQNIIMLCHCGERHHVV